MSKMKIAKCSNCNFEFNPEAVEKCPVCQTLHSATNKITIYDTPVLNSGASQSTEKRAEASAAEHQTWSQQKRRIAQQGLFIADRVDGNSRLMRAVGIVSVIVTYILNVIVLSALTDNFFVSGIISFITTGIFGFSIIAVSNLFLLISTFIRFRLTE